MQPIKIVLEDKDIPQYWYNVQADLKTPMVPPLHPGTRQPIGRSETGCIGGEHPIVRRELPHNPLEHDR